MQQELILGYYISFETITGGNEKSILCNLSKEQEKVLEVQNGCV